MLWSQKSEESCKIFSSFDFVRIKNLKKYCNYLFNTPFWGGICRKWVKISEKMQKTPEFVYDKKKSIRFLNDIVSIISEKERKMLLSSSKYRFHCDMKHAKMGKGKSFSISRILIGYIVTLALFFGLFPFSPISGGFSLKKRIYPKKKS